MKAKTLIAAARAARLRAYAPYSGFLVGAALLTGKGAVVTGANTENSSYGMTVCAERVAIWTAVHSGWQSFKSIAVVADSISPPSPCGACRQVLWELAGNIEVIMSNLQEDITIMPLIDMLPKPFGSAAWNLNPVSEEMINNAEMWRIPVSFHPVGCVVNAFRDPGDIPKNYKDLMSRIVIDPEMEEGLHRLDEEEIISVISYLHQAPGYTLKDKRSGRGNEVFGIFACRAPHRPNAIAQSTVELIEVNRNILTVKGLDLINGTPVLDLKTVYR